MMIFSGRPVARHLRQTCMNNQTRQEPIMIFSGRRVANNQSRREPIRHA